VSRNLSLNVCLFRTSRLKSAWWQCSSHCVILRPFALHLLLFSFCIVGVCLLYFVVLPLFSSLSYKFLTSSFLFSHFGRLGYISIDSLVVIRVSKDLTISIFTMYIIGAVLVTELLCPNCRAVKDVGIRPLACCDRGFESHRRHGCLLCVLSGRGLCDELISRPEESYRLWHVVVCD
jgi:hypothetical protein